MAETGDAAVPSANNNVAIGQKALLGIDEKLLASKPILRIAKSIPLDAQKLADSCKGLLDTLNLLHQDLQLGFALEIIPDGDTFGGNIFAQLQLAPTVWLDRVLIEHYQLPRVLCAELASVYVQDERVRLLQLQDDPPSEKCDSLESLCNNFSHTQSQHNCTKPHGKQCSAKLVRKNSTILQCPFTVNPLLSIPAPHMPPNSQRLQCIILARAEPLREIMIAAPIPHKNNDPHYDNRALAVLPNFWLFVIAAFHNMKPVEVEMFAMNFGVWETMQAEDELATNCHGHGHLWLTREGASKFPKLKGRVYRMMPTNKLNLEKDLERLESRANTLSLGSIRTNMETLKTDMETLKTDMETLKTDMVEMKTDMVEMKGNVGMILKILQQK